MNLPASLSTSTPASEVSSADAAQNDGPASSETAVPNMADILKNSPMAKLLGASDESPPDDVEDALTQDDDTEGKDPASEEESENATDEGNETDETEAPADADDESTREAELPSEDSIDWEYKIPVKIDGKVQHLTLEEVRKGYATDQHLSNEGRKLGELKKQVEIERTEKLADLIKIGTALNSDLTATEDALQTQYHKISADIEKARDEGDTYAARELKEKREAVQEDYWKARNGREEKTKLVTEQWQAQQAEQQKSLLEKFNVDIKIAIPDFNEKVAGSVREFALKEGIPEALLNSVYDANVVKLLNDYRKLKNAKDVGAMRRKETPVTKSVPSKKGTPSLQREQQSNQANRNKVLSGQGDKGDELDFLKRISSISRKL